MRETGRGGSLVAATIAALTNRAVVEDKPPTGITLRVPSAKIRNVDSERESKFAEERLRRASGGSERPLSTASETSERDSASVQSSEEPPPQDSGDSDSPDETTVKCTVWSDNAIAGAQPHSSESDSSSSSDEDSEGREYEPRGGDADYRTLTPSKRLDNSTRRDDDFKWMPPGDIDEDVAERMEARTEDYGAASLDRRRRLPSDRSDRDRKSRSSMTGKPPQHPSSVRTSPRPRRPRYDDTPPDLQRRWNSYEHFRWPEGAWWPPMCWCHGPPVPPPCCMHERTWPSHPSLPQTHMRSNKNDAEDRVRRLEVDKESLHLQVQVLSEQIAAQSEKMADLERALHETRQKLDDADQRLQKEMLQRSSLETQKLELLSKLSEVRLRAAERGLLERSPPPEASVGVVTTTRPAPPRTPPANYGRQIERNTHMYSSLPRSSIVTSSEARVAFGNKQNNMVVARGRGHSVPNLGLWGLATHIHASKRLYAYIHTFQLTTFTRILSFYLINIMEQT